MSQGKEEFVKGEIWDDDGNPIYRITKDDRTYSFSIDGFPKEHQGWLKDRLDEMANEIAGRAREAGRLEIIGGMKTLLRIK